MEDIKKLRCIHLADKRDNEKLCNAIEQVKFLNVVIDMMAKDLQKYTTIKYAEDTKLMNGPYLMTMPELIKGYYFKKARGEKDE